MKHFWKQKHSSRTDYKKRCEAFELIAGWVISTAFPLVISSLYFTAFPPLLFSAKNNTAFFQRNCWTI